MTIDGDNPGISGGISINGKDANAGLGIFNQQVLVNGLVVKNNIIKNFSRYGVFLQRNGQPTVTEGIDIANNHIDNISSATNNGRGVAMFNNAYAEIRNNTFTRIVTGILFANGSLAPSTPTNITGNSLETYSTAIQFANMNVFLQTLNISGNTISTSNLINWNAPGATQSNFGSGISMTANVTGNAFFNNNNIGNSSFMVCSKF